MQIKITLQFFLLHSKWPRCIKEKTADSDKDMKKGAHIFIAGGSRS